VVLEISNEECGPIEAENPEFMEVLFCFSFRFSFNFRFSGGVRGY